MDEYLHDAVLSAPPEWMFEPRDNHMILTAAFPCDSKRDSGSVSGGSSSSISSSIAPQTANSCAIANIHAPSGISDFTLAEHELSPWLRAKQLSRKPVPEASTELLLL
jgi:hypothetical protein